MPRELRPLPWIVVVLTLASIVLDLVNDRFWASDFRVYWSAAYGLLDDGPVYGVAFGEHTGFYKYAPVVALAFAPATLLPYGVAAALHVLLSGLLLIPILVTLERIQMRHLLGLHAPRILVRHILVLMCCVVLLARELHLGNINLWLVLGMVLATEALLHERDALAGSLLGAMWLLKPYLVFTVIPLVIHGRWRVLQRAVLTIAAGLVLPLVALGPGEWFALHRAWISAMAAHGGYLTSPDTFQHLLGHWVDPELMRHPRALIILCGALLAALCWWQRRRMNKGGPALAVQLWLSFALVPHLVITDQEHFLYSLPLIAFTLAVLFARSSRLWTTVFVCAAALYAARSSDLWGNALEARMAAWGALGIGNALLWMVAAAQTGRCWRL
jgi:hypothetical protein